MQGTAVDVTQTPIGKDRHITPANLLVWQVVNNHMPYDIILSSVTVIFSKFDPA